MLNISKLAESTLKEYIEIIPSPVSDLLPWNSNFGGAPFLPINIPYPTNVDGAPLYLLAQLNFSEIPNITPFPKKGLLQFYINCDDLYGMDKGAYELIYIPDINPNASYHILTSLPKPQYFPMNNMYALEFSKKRMCITTSDYKFHDVYEEVLTNNKEYSDNFENEYGSKFDTPGGHRIGGYPNFCQSDPRDYSYNRGKDKDVLLLQIDSDNNIQWGDSGVCNFFIAEEKLKDLNFSDILYYWDCC